MTTIII